jgi:hypothetical protein
MLINKSKFIQVGNRRDALGTAQYFYGNAVTRATVLSDVDTNPGMFPCAIGSVYVTNGGHGMYIKVAQSTPPAATDWQKVTTTAAD